MGEGKKRALVIGIDEYEDEQGFSKLNYAKNDANDIKDILENQEIGGFEVISCIGKPTRSEVAEKLGEIFGKAREDDTVLIYFSGHGKLDDNNELYLAFHDTKSDNLIGTSIDLETIKKMIARSKCKNKALIIDSCYSGGAGAMAEKGGPEVEIDNSLKPILDVGAIVFSASQKLQKSFESADKKHGVFTHYLLKGLREGEADDGKDPYVSINDLYKYVSEQVEAETNSKQMPGKWPKENGADVVIAKSFKYLEKARAEIDTLFDSASGFLNNGDLAKALDTLNKILRRDPRNTKAFQEIQRLCEDMDSKLRNYQNSDENETLSTPIYNEALEILNKPYSDLTEKEKKRVRVVASFLSGLSLKNFERDWWEVEKIEKSNLDKQKKEHEDKIEKERQQREEQESQKKAVQAGDIGPGKPLPPADSDIGKRSGPEVPKLDQKVERNQILISYSGSDEDKKWLERFQHMLKPLSRKMPKEFKIWSDDQIKPGAKWREEIEKALASAKVAVLLVSQDFLGSDFIMEKQLPPLLNAAEKEGLDIFWVNVRPNTIEEVPEIERYQCANDKLKPLSSFEGVELENELIKLYSKIKDAMVKGGL
jgi:tetratricopeptide (TPR) repeat protein